MGHGGLDPRLPWSRIIDRQNTLQQVPSLNGSAVNLVLVQLVSGGNSSTTSSIHGYGIISIGVDVGEFGLSNTWQTPNNRRGLASAPTFLPIFTLGYQGVRGLLNEVDYRSSKLLHSDINLRVRVENASRLD